jgi:dTDP-4-amino-4,6-dideoxygalactose transaminase
LEAIKSILESGWITTGPKTREFEERLGNIVAVHRWLPERENSRC